MRHRSLARGSAFLILSSVSSYALVRLLPPLPFLRRPASSIVSYGSLHGHAPLENLLLYALALAIAVCVAALLLRVGDAAPGGEARDWPRPAFVLALALLAAVAVNASWIDPAAMMTDTFHEGEMIAYGPAFRTGGLASALIIHGPGIDLAPHLLASSLHPGAAIATTRALHMLEGLVFWGGFCWGVLELLALAGGARIPPFARLFVLLVCAVPLGATGFTGEMSRKTILALQFALLARGLRVGAKWPVAILAGISVAAGFAYNYLEGLAGAVLVATGAALWWLRGERRGAAVAAAGALGSCVAGAALAGGGLSTAIAQVAYWARNGQLVWGLPLRRNPALVLIGLFGPIVALQAAAGLRLWRARAAHGGWRRVAVEEAGLLLSLLLSLACARSWVDRADDLHLELAGWMTVPLLLMLIAPVLERAVDSGRARAASMFAVAAIPVLGFAALPVANPLLAAARLLRIPSASKTPDTKVVDASYVDGVRAVAPGLASSDCFWTLTSEGVWYDLFDRPSCTRFHQVVYARSSDAQAEVVRDLERTRPPYVLFGNSDWWNRVDGIPIAVTNRPIESYVLSWYRPWRRIGDHWFWKRARSPLARDAGKCVRGSVADAQVTDPGVARLSGTVDVPGTVIYVEASRGDLLNAQEAAAGTWTVEVPADAIAGARAYGYDAAREVLSPLCPGTNELVTREPR